MAELGQPQRGLAQLQYDEAPLAGWLLAIEATGELAGAGGDAWTPADAYVRGRDLVVAYGAGPNLPFGMQIYWRVSELASGEPLVLDAIVSIQTRAWEAFPAVAIGSALAVESAAADDEAIILRPSGADWIYAEMAHHGDFLQQPVEVTAEGLVRTAWGFGREFMERGVIRRLRIRGSVVPRNEEAAIIEQQRKSLAAEAPPLTA